MPRRFKVSPAVAAAIRSSQVSAARNVMRRGMRKYKAKMSAKRVAQIARKAVRRYAETKYVSDNFDKNANAVLPAVWNLTNVGANVLKFLPMLPRTTQGVDEYQRIGDTIIPVGQVCTTLEFSYNDSDISGHQIKVEIYYGTTKGRRSWADQNPLSTAAFLDDGQGGNVAPSAARQTTQLPMDKRLVSFKKRVFILSKTSGTIGGPNGTSNYSANGGRSYFNIKLYSKPPTKLKYLDSIASYPTNFAPGYFINLSYVDGVVPVNQQEIDSLVNITSRTHLHFQDV